MPKPVYQPVFNLWLEKEGKTIVGENLAQVLECIQATGSLIAACRILGISYAHAWEKIDKAQKILGKTILEARRGGGGGGGGCRLTETGVKLVTDYKELYRRIETVLVNELEGSRFRRRLFQESQFLPDFAVIGSHCIGVEILLELLKTKLPEARIEVAYVGSAGGLTAIMLGEADVAGVHLLDEETGEYNLPYLKRSWIEDRAVLVRGYAREQGFIVAKGNPKGIHRVEDLLTPNMRFINREAGSGTKALLDRHLRVIAASKGVSLMSLARGIKGYGLEVRSHRDVAKAVVAGRTDVGLGIRAAAAEFNLDFIQLAEEFFDFVVDEMRLTKPIVEAFIELLGSKAFEEELATRTLGLRILPDTGRILYRPSK